MKYAFIKRHEHEHSVRRMCKIMTVHPSGYYAWKADPVSPRAQDDQRVLGLLKHAWLESGGVYGYRKLTLDMRDLGESCGKHRVARLLKLEGLRSQTGYRRRPGMRGGKPAVVAPNHLQRQFSVAQPNQSWVRAGCTWPWWSICSRVRWSAGQWVAASIPRWRSMRW